MHSGLDFIVMSKEEFFRRVHAQFAFAEKTHRIEAYQYGIHSI